MISAAGSVPALIVETQAIDDIGPLVPLLDPQHPLLFVRLGDGIAGIGETLRLEFTGPNRITDAADTWQRVVSAATITDPVSAAGSGLVALGAFAFSKHSQSTSVLIVPTVILGRRGDTHWITRIRRAPAPADAGSAVHTLPVPAPQSATAGAKNRISLLPGAMSPDAFGRAVAAAVERIQRHDLSKVVLARDLVGTVPEGSDLRPALGQLASTYPDCFTFAVDGLIGSSPETLVQAQHGNVSARVLAGSAGRGVDAVSDRELAEELASSAKNLEEHQYALDSVLDTLAPYSRDLRTTEKPFTLELPNLWHLASDVAGTLENDASILNLVAALHPTAAVAGSPTPDAVRLIEELEPFDRGRYAGPVGWVDANGGGEWAIALRCAQIAPDGTITAYAGAGLVDGSEAARELAETVLKFRPIVEAFS